MKSSTYLNFSIMCSILILAACIDKIELKNQEFTSKALVIQGKLVRGKINTTLEATIQRLGEFGNSEREAYITSAKVELIDANDRTIELKADVGKTVYRLTILETNLTFKIEIGKQYRLRATMPDGKIYISDPESLNPVPKVDKIWFEKGTQTVQNDKGIVLTKNILRFKLNTPVTVSGASEKIKLRWESFIHYRLTDDASRVCYVWEPQKLEKVNIFDASLDNTNKIDSILLLETALDHRFAEGSYISIIQESLSGQAYLYWDQVKKLAERSGNMFEAPAATISTNIKSLSDKNENVFGYFYASAQDTIRLYLDTLVVGPLTHYCPQPPTERIGPTICTTCLLIGNTSSTIKPHFWK